MNVELVTRRKDLAALTQRWDELAQTDLRDGFFRTSTWFLSWIEHVRQDAKPFVVVVRDNAGEIVGLAPLCRLTNWDLGFPLTGISSAGREVVSGDFLDFVSERAERATITSAILGFLWDVRSKWSMLTLGELLDGSESHRALENLGDKTGLAVRLQEERTCPHIVLPGSFEEYLSSLSNSSRYHIRRRFRDIVEKKGGRIEVFSKPQDIANHLDLLIRLHLARWRSKNLPGTMGQSGFAPFLKQVCGKPPAGSECRLYLLTYGGSPAAALLTFYFGQSALYYQAGWDPNSPIAHLSPGVVLMAQSIRDAIEHGLRYYEFLRGDEAYKSRWTKTYRKTITILLARSLLAKQYVRIARMKDSVKRLIGSRPNGKQDSGATIETTMKDQEESGERKSPRTGYDNPHLTCNRVA